jgi:16S rRNA (cytosine1402-N4)-methyltransferase
MIRHDKTDAVHRPVMLAEVMAVLSPRSGEAFVDATFGAGGYSRGLLERADCRVIAIDRDPDAVARARAMAEAFPGRLFVLSGRFADMVDLLAGLGIRSVDGVVLDLGVSSAQLDQAERGFSFRRDGPLDMRMERAGVSAAEVVNTSDEATIARIISSYGEERYARRIARSIVEARSIRPIERTRTLADIVDRAVPRRRARGEAEIHPATRTFQALRIHVNDEIGELKRGLAAAERLLAPGGRLAVVSFHSLEDREVKRFLNVRSGRVAGSSRHRPARDVPVPSFRLLHRKALRPAADELGANPRARSARLRAAERTDAPALEVAA